MTNRLNFLKTVIFSVQISDTLAVWILVGNSLVRATTIAVLLAVPRMVSLVMTVSSAFSAGPVPRHRKVGQTSSTRMVQDIRTIGPWLVWLDSVLLTGEVISAMNLVMMLVSRFVAGVRPSRAMVQAVTHSIMMVPVVALLTTSVMFTRTCLRRRWNVRSSDEMVWALVRRLPVRSLPSVWCSYRLIGMTLMLTRNGMC